MESINKKWDRKINRMVKYLKEEKIKAIKYHDIAKNIKRDWEANTLRVEGSILSNYYPISIYLNLSQWDRLEIMNFFIEEIEEKYNLEFISISINDQYIYYIYEGLSITFMIHSKGTCQIVYEEVRDYTTKKISRVICKD